MASFLAPALRSFLEDIISEHLSMCLALHKVRRCFGKKVRHHAALVELTF